MRHIRVIRQNAKPRKPMKRTVAELFRLYHWFRFNKCTRRESVRKAWRNWK